METSPCYRCLLTHSLGRDDADDDPPPPPPPECRLGSWLCCRAQLLDTGKVAAFVCVCVCKENVLSHFNNVTP